MKQSLSRREFLRRATFAAASAVFCALFITRNLIAAPPPGKVLHASIGAGGHAAADLGNFTRHPFLQLAAVADVDEAKAARWKEQFPATPHSDGKTVNVTWYDGDELPSREVQALIGEEKMPGCGSIFIGTKGVMLLPHIAKPKLFPEKNFVDFPMPKVEDSNHYTLFVDAVRGNGRTTAGFDYAGPLTEAVLLGGVASRFPKTTLQWDARRLKFKNVSEANAFLKRRYRQGWEVKGLA